MPSAYCLLHVFMFTRALCALVASFSFANSSRHTCRRLRRFLSPAVLSSTTCHEWAALWLCAEAALVVAVTGCRSGAILPSRHPWALDSTASLGRWTALLLRQDVHGVTRENE